MSVKKFYRRYFLLTAAALAAVRSFAAEPPAPAAAAPGVTLADCFQRAKSVSETIGISEENIRLAEHQIRQERGAVFPHISWVKEQFYQDKGGEAGAGNPLQTQPLSYFQLTQPIYAGFRDWRTIDIAKSVKEQAKYNRIQTDLQLLSDVATAFYTALSYSNQLAVLQDTRKIIADRIDQLKHWVAVGRSREDEVLSEETQMAMTDAQIEDVKRSLMQARQSLYFLTRVPADTALIDDRPLPAPSSAEDAVTRAGKRPDLLSTAETVRQAELAVRVARGAHYPTLGFNGKSYTERVGPLSDVRWDATFLLDVPLFEGGSTQAGVNAARSQEIIAQLTLARLKREVERQVRSANDDLLYAVSATRAYNKAVDLSLRNYKVQDKEYRRGSISNLELLQTLRDMQNTRSQAVMARASAKLSDVLLRVAVGEGL